MALDVAAILASIPASLALSKSDLSFDPLSPFGLAIWASVAVASHLLFRFNGLYSTIWRLASTQDFINITRACLILTFGLYAIALYFRFFVGHVLGLNERQFIVFFLITITIIAAPRLLYRYLRDGDRWWAPTRHGDECARRRALFVGGLDEADSAIRLARARSLKGADGSDINVVSILAPEGDESLRRRIQGVPVLGRPERLQAELDEEAQSARPVDLVIFGTYADQVTAEFVDLVRVARREEKDVVQFQGLSPFHSEGTALEAVDIERVLKRVPVQSDTKHLGAFCRGRRIMVTGGAGSIGSVLVGKSLEFGAEHVLVVDRSEFGIFLLQGKVPEAAGTRLTSRIVDICDEEQMSRVIAEFAPDVIFHAAALKHVPILEENWIAAVQTNVFGTMTCAELAAKHGVPQFVLISSDKAVDPASVLGYTKRMAEQIVNALHFAGRAAVGAGGASTSYTAVRFGNVFGSDGSVATVFRRQIDEGLPVTVTDPLMTRYFMTISEAVDLVIAAAADAAGPHHDEDYGIYMLDMGEPVSILRMAETMIKLAGRVPYTEVPISFTGIRPGEKLHEKLHSDSERVAVTRAPKILGVTSGLFGRAEVRLALRSLKAAIARNEKSQAIDIMEQMFRPACINIPADAAPDRNEATGT